MSPRPTLLVNYWYAHPVGHAIEGLRYALGYHEANPELRVSLLLNAATPAELGRCCPFLDRVFAVPFTEFPRAVGDAAAALAEVPRDWDHVVENHRARDRSHDRFEGFRRFFDAARRHLRPRHELGVAGAEPPAYLPHRTLRLELPETARAAARSVLGPERRAISVVLAGGSTGRELYPSVTSWRRILAALADRHPDAAIVLIGKLRTTGARSRSLISREEVDRILGVAPRVIDAFDRPLMEQLALVEASELFLSPHTGFGFAAVSVGTPWLELSGGTWHQSFFNGVPFYCVLPDTKRYPAFTWGGPLSRIEEDTDGEGPRTPSMCAARIREDLPALLDGADLLIRKRICYEDALGEYFPRLLAAYGGDRSRVFSFDGIHTRFLP